MRLVLALVLFPALVSTASAQHHAAAAEGGAGVAEAFVVDGFRVDPVDPPPGSGVGRAGLRFDDGGYVSVVYGKPYARGRQIFGGVVGYGQVWAAGAHRATELVTTVPLVVGTTRVEPGAYSLFLTPEADAWTLHVNRRLGAHLADEYDPAEDVATVTVAPEVIDPEVEALTWSFASDGSTLSLAWGPLVASFPLARADR